MDDIISLEKYQDRKQKKQENTEDIKNIDAFLSYMASDVTKVLNNIEIEMMEEREIQERKRFEERYKDVLPQAPDSAEAQLQYFASILLAFLPTIFHGEQKDRFNTYMDFSEFYLSEFDTAFSQYRNKNKECEQEYPFRFSPLPDPDTLENELQDCLLQIINSSSVKSSSERTEIIMWQACRLFELYHNMADLFLEKGEAPTQEKK